MLFRVLGSMSVTDNGEDRTPSAPKHRQMLALLLMNADHVVSTAQFVEELWEYNPPPQAVAAVHTYVMQLRRLLRGPAGTPADGPGRLLTRDQGYLLRVEDGELDLHAHRRHLRAGRALLAAGDLAAGARRIRVAHALWGGAGLPDVPTGPLLRAALAPLERERDQATLERVRAELALGRHHELLAELCALVHQDLANEELTAQLMTALYRSGRQADALAAFHRLRHALREDFDTTPGPEVHRLITDILAGHPRLEPPATAGPALSLDAVTRPRALPAPDPAPAHRLGTAGRSPEAGRVLLGA
ncbi:AfsR/SARP family transcriptional regulator (plasmid) [Streptomyces sp. BI20]|uniref:AfsR/SARP family transcriptional regulator n=1 Tax=Streptomyces sp. BI20 TaxID=3403460 RepID=UPI003C70C398